jgi:hypothetical protein
MTRSKEVMVMIETTLSLVEGCVQGCSFCIPVRLGYALQVSIYATAWMLWPRPSAAASGVHDFSPCSQQ